MNNFEIIIEGHVDAKRYYDFERLSIQHLDDGTTAVTGYITDQATLFALLGRIRDLGIKLIAVKTKEE